MPNESYNLVPIENQPTVLLDVHATLEAWLTKTIKLDSLRARDLRNDKGKAVADFFDWVDKSPETVQPRDLQMWIDRLKKQKFAPGTIYNRLSAISTYFEYLRRDVGLERIIPVNPAKVTLPPKPKPYQSKTVKALTSDELFNLLSVVESYVQSGELMHLRDHAILQFFATTGRRREEIIGLTGEHIEPRGKSLLIRPKVKGGHYQSFELSDAIARDALLNYLEATGRDESIFGTPIPLWLRHDKGAANLVYPPLTSHGFAKRMQIYAAEAEIDRFHIHRLRHTYATIVADEFESIADAQEALGHSDSRITRIYVKNLKVTKDKFSGSIRRAMKREKELRKDD